MNYLYNCTLVLLLATVFNFSETKRVLHQTSQLDSQNYSYYFLDDCTTLIPVSATASSVMGAGVADFAIDGNPGTRWESEFEDPQDITIELANVSLINSISITWETAGAADYVVKGSVDGMAWVDITSFNDLPYVAGGREDVIENINADYKYIQIYGTERNTPYGYSIWEVTICGAAPLNSDKFEQDSFNFFPNPTTGVLSVKSKQDSTVQVLDQTGKVIIEAEVTQGLNSLNIESLNPGIYFVTMNTITKKLVVK